MLNAANSGPRSYYSAKSVYLTLRRLYSVAVAVQSVKRFSFAFGYLSSVFRLNLTCSTNCRDYLLYFPRILRKFLPPKVTQVYRYRGHSQYVFLTPDFTSNGDVIKSRETISRAEYADLSARFEERAVIFLRPIFRPPLEVSVST